MHPAGGEWYSHPVAGKCTGDQRVGDGSGCTWRVVAINKILNASCMYGNIDGNVEQHNEDCFSACSQPHNVTSDFNELKTEVKELRKLFKVQGAAELEGGEGISP